MPTTGNIAPGQASSQRTDEHASAGYYAVRLSRFAVGVEISTAQRAAIYRFSYPAGQRANLLIDVGRCLLSNPRGGESQSITASQIHILSSTRIAAPVA